jgi:hypothetical protein
VRLLREQGGDEAGPRELAAASLVAALVTAVAAQLVLGWPVLSLASGLVGLLLPGWYFRQRSASPVFRTVRMLSQAEAARYGWLKPVCILSGVTLPEASVDPEPQPCWGNNGPPSPFR